MMISDLAVKRPVLAAVASLLLIALGLIAFTRLPLRELPDVDRPIVSVSTSYRGAAAEVVETQITQVIEDQLSGIEGVDFISSNSRDGRSSITIEFALGRDLDAAANDVRTAVDRVINRMPVNADPPQIQKTDADSEPIMFLNLTSTTMSRMELTDYAERVLVDRFTAIDGVASVRLGGGVRQSMRVWLDPEALAARGLTADDVDSALRSQNVELPAGAVESVERDYVVRVGRIYRTAEDFRAMPVGRSGEGGVIRLGDVAQVEVGPEDDRRIFRGNGVNQIGLGIVRQSRSNALDVGRAAKAEMEAIKPTLPEGMDFFVGFDSTVFIERAVERVWVTMAEAVGLTILVIFLFIGSVRAALIPAATIPVCLIGVFALFAVLGFSINLITLLALVLAIGLVVDDSIIVLENCQRRVDLGEPPLIAAQRGARQVGFAVIATTAVLVSVFTPLFFTGGFVGRLFIELAVAIAGAVVISAFVALTLSPMMASKLLRPSAQSGNALTRTVDRAFVSMRESYAHSVGASLKAPWGAFIVLALVSAGGYFMFTSLNQELSPREDRGNLLINLSMPEGTGYEMTRRTLLQVEPMLMEYVESGEATRLLIIAPRFGDAGAGGGVSGGFIRMFLAPWEDRDRTGREIVDELNRKLAQYPAGQFRAAMPSAFGGGGPGGGGGGDASIVLTGSDYEELAAAAARVIKRIDENPNLARPRMNFERDSPRIEAQIDRERAAALGVSPQAIGRTLEAMMGSRRVTTFPDRGEEYDVWLQLNRNDRQSIEDMQRIYVRSNAGDLVPLANVVTFRAFGDTDVRPRVNRLRAVSVSASMTGDYTLGQALDFMEQASLAEIKPGMGIDYQGETRELRQGNDAFLFAFALALLIVFLTLAAQFESWIHPLVIMLTVPLAVAGGLFGLYAAGYTINIYSQIGLIILVALATKNGILIVEFANQLRDEGRSVRDAIVEAAELRLRPILMTSFATIAGAVPLMLGGGAGGETRSTIGVVIVFGVLGSTALTLYVVPVFYNLLARFTRSPEELSRQIEAYEAEHAEPANANAPGYAPKAAE